jgi:hypothetical protein
MTPFWRLGEFWCFRKRRPEGSVVEREFHRTDSGSTGDLEGSGRP